MSLFTTIICLIACHGGPADHFAAFAKNLSQKGYEVQVYASGPAVKKFQEHGIPITRQFAADQLSAVEEANLAADICKSCSKASVVLTDAGHLFDASLQKALAENAPKVLRLAYYDNPEAYVPGGYSSIAAQVMLLAQKVLFANANLADASIFQEENKEIPLKNRVGLGYYPIADAEKVAARRQEDHSRLRLQLLAKHGIEDRGQKVLIYFGGNNEEYFTKAFPAFLSFLSQSIECANLSDQIIVLQQHPGAKSKNLDRQAMQKWATENRESRHAPKVIVSDESSDEMQVTADMILYYQTSMGPLFVLAGIPVVQVGHKAYEDILIKRRLCLSVTNAKDFVNAISEASPAVSSAEQREIIFRGLGIRGNWFEILEQALLDLMQGL